MQIRRWIFAAAIALLCAAGELCWVWKSGMTQSVQGDFIQYVDFNVPEQVLEDAMEEDIKREGEISWITILAGLACQNGANWDGCQSEEVTDMALRLEQGEEMEENQYFSYYQQVYQAVLGGLLGDFAEERTDSDGSWDYQYGLKAFLPLAAGFDYSESDDFGAQRTYGYSRRHLGHDMMGLTGTPVVAVESGTVTMLGWNQYGGWRVGIRSDDGKRYWYYAHLRKDRPYASGLRQGDRVTAGDVIGYMGRTGYSAEENVNNIETPHLHIGLELIFDESQFESDNEIWVDVYPLMQLLRRHQSACIRGDEGEYTRAAQFLEAST
jgi:hypothetical protein